MAKKTSKKKSTGKKIKTKKNTGRKKSSGKKPSEYPPFKNLEDLETDLNVVI